MRPSFRQTVEQIWRWRPSDKTASGDVEQVEQCASEVSGGSGLVPDEVVAVVLDLGQLLAQLGAAFGLHGELVNGDDGVLESKIFGYGWDDL